MEDLPSPGSESHVTVQKRAYYSPPWADVSIIAVAGSSGSGKSTLSQAIVKKLNLPWVVILSMVSSFYLPTKFLAVQGQTDTDTVHRTPSTSLSRQKSQIWHSLMSGTLTPQVP